ncbi:hypothetical protein GCM10023193_11860 [Planotetraspora kaengkrachanensis]|uniref:Uncharacterized protein n=1 Tax=Planotetraspora kaengkrachanensis TaxID=575193 RepID=A0A8J3PWG8_9ACTN|nr:hypothetical protein Pka01_53300 [Planotetraspora kaengkrachanensis]
MRSVPQERCGTPPVPRRPLKLKYGTLRPDPKGGTHEEPYAPDCRPARPTRPNWRAIGGIPLSENGQGHASGCVSQPCRTSLERSRSALRGPGSTDASVFPGDVTVAGSVGSMG